MKTLAALLLSCSAVHAQSFGALTATPTHPTPGIQLSWGSSPAGTNSVRRWTDANPTPVVIGTTAGTTYLDTTPVANTIYYYSVANGPASTNTFPGVVSDLNLPFNCPPMVPVDPSKLGVDRTETFTGADGSTVSFTIQAPIAAKTSAHILNVPPCNGAVGCSDYTNVNNALASIASTGGTVQLSAGDYHFINPAWAPGFNWNISMVGTDMILAGAPVASGAEPTTRLFFNQGGLATAGQVVGLSSTGNRQLVRNVTIDWDFPTALPGTITNFDASHQHFNIINGPYYIPDPANPPSVYVLSGYNLARKTYNMKSGARIGGVTAVFNTNFASDGLYYYTLNGGRLLPDGTEAIMFVKTRLAILPGTDALNQSFENIRVYGGGGPGIIQGAHAQGLRLSNFVIERKPDALLAPGEQSRYVSLFGDSDSNGSLGSVLIENSVFGYVDDDTYYMRGSVFQLQTLTSTSGFVMKAPLVINHNPGPNDFLKFMDPTTLKQIGTTMPLATWTHVGDAWTFSFPAVPELAPYIGLPAARLPWVGQPAWSAPNFIIRNICSHDNHGRLGFLNYNGLVENNVLGNSYYGPIVGYNLAGQPGLSTTFGDGPGPVNHIWRNNKIINVGYGMTDFLTVWAPTVVGNGYRQTGWGAAAISLNAVATTGFFPPGYTAANIEISGNFISNTNGLCILVASGYKVDVVNNTCVDANQISFAAGFHATHCGVNSRGWQRNGTNQPWCLAKVAAQGAIMITNSRNVDVSGNIFLGTSQGLFIDTPTVTGDR